MAAALIHLFELAKAYSGPPPRIVLRPTTMAIPADRNVAILGEKHAGKSTLIKLLAGLEEPTRGRVVCDVRCSPLIRAGALFHPKLSKLDNVRFYARALNISIDELSIAVDSFHPAGSGTDTASKAAAIGFLGIVPYHCYLVDEIGHLPTDIRERHFAAAASRKAGVIFTTSRAKMARLYAECAIVIRDGILHPFANVEQALRFNDRR